MPILLTFNFFIIPFLVFLFTYLKINILNVRSFNSTKDLLFKKQNIKSNTNTISLIKVQLTLLLLLLIFIPKVFYTNNYVNINALNFQNLILLYLVTLLFFYNNSSYNSHWVLGLYSNILISPLLLCSNDLLSFYILLEINAYIFIYISITQVFFLKQNQHFSVVNSTIINFILNFFSSIFFFIALSYIYYYNSDFIFFEQKNLFFLIFFFIKISLGPWLYISVDIYKGLTLYTLLFYTVIFLLILLPKFIEFSFKLLLFFNTYLIILILLYLIFLLYSINTIYSLKVFLGYSTSITLTYIIVILVSFSSNAFN